MNKIVADEGKVFRRISDGTLYGNEISLGYSYYINGVKLAEPHLDVPEDFEQVDEPVRAKNLVEVKDNDIYFNL